jgi:hypothetical protein
VMANPHIPYPLISTQKPNASERVLRQVCRRSGPCR